MMKTFVWLFFLQANSWCARGIELLASQRIEKCSISPEYADESLQELQQFVLSASEFCITSSPSELRDVFQESATPETKALVAQVILLFVQTTHKCFKQRKFHAENRFFFKFFYLRWFGTISATVFTGNDNGSEFEASSFNVMVPVSI